jgi:hypothetical protein
MATGTREAIIAAQTRWLYVKPNGYERQVQMTMERNRLGSNGPGSSRGGRPPPDLANSTARQCAEHRDVESRG